MLGDFLSLQIICTINCSASEIDPALLRPGRLLSHRVFERLDPSQADRLAASTGKSLPEACDYSLAEVFPVGRKRCRRVRISGSEELDLHGGKTEWSESPRTAIPISQDIDAS